MEINPTAAAAASAAAESARRGQLDQAKASAASDFQTFLTLLTAQMRNQDPMKPIESTEFVAQLASFSSVEQAVRANDRLELILEALGGGSHAGLAQWIGREVRAPVAANYQGVPVDVEVGAHAQADARTLVVRNAFGQVVARLPVEAGRTNVVWDGRTTLGEPAAHGSYRFEVENRRGETLIDSAPGRVFSLVTEVRLVAGAPVLVLDGGDTTALDGVTAVR